MTFTDAGTLCLYVRISPKDSMHIL